MSFNRKRSDSSSSESETGNLLADPNFLDVEDDDAMKKRKAKLDPLRSRCAVPPIEGNLTSPFSQHAKKKLSEEILRQRLHEQMGKKLASFNKYAPTFRTKFRLDELQPSTPGNMAEYARKHLGDDVLPQVISGKWVDADDEPLLFYLGQRDKNDNTEKPMAEDLDAQYVPERTSLDHPGASYVHDGLPPAALERLWQATQDLCSQLPPKIPPELTRHGLQRRDGGDDRVMEYRMEDGSIREERRGVHHLVQGWVMQGHHDKLYLSADIHESSSGVAATRAYYTATKEIAGLLGLVVKTLLPEQYEKYQEAFEAGVWFADEDPGPFLGRAVVWKLQLRMHKDKADAGFSISIPFGAYTGGYMIIPQLHAKLSYHPGDLCIFLSSKLYHQVSRWEPTDGMQKGGLTPGRSAHVFFFPKPTFQLLQDKPKFWGRNTAYGNVGDVSKVVG
ncbi:hypothetical protein PTI98_009331 [Pleurotus ostreatus]|nr:hypothetical protein PTI98_009331 [Pleurotus ostreatus]